jgi:predicted PurR-regulated permease PerM
VLVLVAAAYLAGPVSRYIGGQVVVAAVDAVGIGAALLIIDVPLVLPLALLTFLGGSVPIVGATVAGAVAALVAFVANAGLVDRNFTAVTPNPTTTRLPR